MEALKTNSKQQPDDELASNLESSGTLVTKGVNSALTSNFPDNKEPSTSRIMKKVAVLHTKKGEFKLQKFVYIYTGETPFKCDFCEYKSSKKHRLIRHTTLTHSNNNNSLLYIPGGKSSDNNLDGGYSCNICSYTTNQEDALKVHISNHKSEKSFSCFVCDFPAFSKDDLRQHISHVHIGGRRYMCKLCTYETTSVKNLKRHMLSHTGEKPSPAICNRTQKCVQKSFSAVRMTRANIENDQNLRVFYCNVCDRTSQSLRKINLHINEHTRSALYKCNLCTFSTQNQVAFRSHLDIHTYKEQPSKKLLSCHLCHLTTYFMWNLKQHILMCHMKHNYIWY